MVKFEIKTEYSENMVNGGLQIAGYFCGLLSGKCRVKFFGVVNEKKADSFETIRC